jgi:Phytanoyl-CoA dioxygenase (PhyH)
MQGDIGILLCFRGRNAQAQSASRMIGKSLAIEMSDPRSLFAGVPLVESPVFKSALEASDLNETERTIAERLNQDGFAVFDFPDEELDARIERIRAHLSPRLGVDDRDPTADKTLTAVGRVQDAWRDDEDVRAIAANAAVMALLSKLYGRRAFPFQTLNFPIGTQQHLHTDIVHFSSVPERFMCGVWLAMEDIQPGAGPLCYVPGSHKWPVISNTIVGRRGWESKLESAQVPYHDAWNALIAEHKSPAEQFLPRKGQALIWSANLLHGGSPQTDPRQTRWSQVTHYFFDDCVYYTPAFSDEPLGRLALRQIVDVSTGREVPNVYLGEEVHPVEQPKPSSRGWRRFRRRGTRQATS